MSQRFLNREAAGEALAGKIRDQGGWADALVLGLPRGGVVVAAAVAQRLELELDVWQVMKVGMPGYSEVAAGAVGPDGVGVWNRSEREGEPDREKGWREREVGQRLQIMKDRERRWRGNKPPLDLSGRTVILVDDGVATGATMLAGAKAALASGAAKVVLAAPMIMVGAEKRFAAEGFDVVQVMPGARVDSVSQVYQHFGQVEEVEVASLLRQAWRRNPGVELI